MAEMKISDLSIGDWVMFTPNETTYLAEPRFTQAPAQITAISRGDVCLQVGEGRGFIAIPLANISAIPLTPEILEKNGFRKLDRFNEYVIGEWDSNPFIAVRLAEKFVEPTILVKNGGTSAHLFGSRGENVHQLQHALRLAGVGKEIEV
jgi:hypothetical protein